MSFQNRAHHFLRCEDGTAAVEYAVVLALVVAAAMGPIQMFGEKLSDTFADIADALPDDAAGTIFVP